MPNVQVTFSGINPNSPTHLLAEGDVATATNVDFSLGGGALMARRGAVAFGQLDSGNPAVTRLFRNYNMADNIDGNPFYAANFTGTVYRGSNSSWTPVVTGTSNIVAINSYQQFALIAAGTDMVKDDGTNVTEWIKQAPTAAPTVTVNTLSPLVVGTSFQILQGSGTAGATCTFVTDDTGVAVVVIPLGTADLDFNSGNKIGNFGVHFVDIAFDDPTLVIRVSQDYVTDLTTSLSTATITVSATTTTVVSTAYEANSYWHAEINPNNGIVVPANADPDTLINSQLSVGTDTSQTPSLDDRARMISEINNSNTPTLSGVSQMGTSFNPWGVTRADFGMVGTYAPAVATHTPWQEIKAVRFVFQFTDVTTATIKGPVAIYGAQNFPLNDVNVGYVYWQTFATLDANNNKIGESAPSPTSKSYTMQQANTVVVGNGTTSGTAHGITHSIYYRQGGLLQTGYAVNTLALATATFTDTMNDIQALSVNDPIVTNIYNQADFPKTVFTIAPIFQNRVFVGERNYVRWSLPGQIDAFPKTSFVQVSNIGDNVKGLIVWPPGITIVNQNSVFELTGSDFEGGQLQLSASGARKGNFAPNTIIRTPYGIPLFNYDGLSMYQPGQGIDIELPWLLDTYGDMFRGGNDNDPAARKGNRIPAINYGEVINACAAYAEGKLYIAGASGTNTDNDTVWVISFLDKKVWWYQYPFNVWSLYWDYQNSRMMAGSDNNTIMQLEHGVEDQTTLETGTGTFNNIVWTARTKTWSVNNDTIMENVSLDSESSLIKVLPVYDISTNTTTATLTNITRGWNTPPLNGSFANAAYFDIVGTLISTNMGALYQLNFDLIPEPVRVQYYRTPYDTHNYEADKLWDVAYYDIDILPGITTASGTDTKTGVIVKAVTYVDTTAVMTNTLTGPTGGRQVFEFAFPAEIYGRVAYTTYTIGTLSGAAGTATYTNTASNFKLWTTYYDARNEPAKINYWRTDIQSMEEQICDAMDTDINPNGTVLGTVYVDNVGVSTATIVGTKRQSYTWTLPNTPSSELYGRTLYAAYTGTGLKHYRTWFHLRQEPDRWTNLITNKISGDEHEWKVFKPELNCLGHAVLCTAFIDGTAVATFTATGSVRMQYTFSLPIRTFGRTIHASYSSADGGTFKHYPPLALGANTTAAEFEGDVEPPRVTTFRTGPYDYPASQYLKTWLVELDPVNGTVTGTLIVDDVVLKTATFEGDRKQWFTVGMDLDDSNVIQTGSRYEVVYSNGQPDSHPSGTSARFKHYETKMETETKPFGKPVWAYSYRKLGGASQVDLARFWSIEWEAPLLSTATYFWDIDGANRLTGTNFATGTITTGGGAPDFCDRIPLPPGGRGYLFLFRFHADQPVKVYKVNLDLDQEGIKGLVRRETPGTPVREQTPHV